MYRPFFIKTFLQFDAARRVARTISEYGPVFPSYRLNLVEVLGDVLTRATRYPGTTYQLPIRITPNPMYHFPKTDFLTADSIVMSSYVVYMSCRFLIEKYPSVPF